MEKDNRSYGSTRQILNSLNFLSLVFHSLYPFFPQYYKGLQTYSIQDVSNGMILQSVINEIIIETNNRTNQGYIKLQIKK